MENLGISTTEFIGYFASLLVLGSFLMKNIKKLRMINTMGCTLFVAYGILLDFSWPIIITNLSIIIINIYYLTKKNIECVVPEEKENDTSVVD
ncbi:MAG: uroporphyrinogen decarboxylase [Flavobacteriales bacterium CG18_big_fil_WC_8_21_14_2_50_32_9]|nr:MAG: uroporphyrinogen decarboxylase [Flavobacteriales bacterium CG18_big_fil_WC_8_21_14_2_50_32_9]PIZ05878.1 MAG: uroporphyrinogen decarboxylase [Flavobacteriales bacterium CG_4_10_14_0_8_um_filter_32_5]